jgi:hypothetical protein
VVVHPVQLDALHTDGQPVDGAVVAHVHLGLAAALDDLHGLEDPALLLSERAVPGVLGHHLLALARDGSRRILVHDVLGEEGQPRVLVHRVPMTHVIENGLACTHGCAPIGQVKPVATDGPQRTPTR